MRRRDFLALCAAAVGCAAVPARKATLTIHEGTFIACQPETWKNPVWRMQMHDGSEWIDLGPVVFGHTTATRAAQPRRS